LSRSMAYQLKYSTNYMTHSNGFAIKLSKQAFQHLTRTQ